MFTFNFGSPANPTKIDDSGILHCKESKKTASSDIPNDFDWRNCSTEITIDDDQIKIVDSNKVLDHLKRSQRYQLDVLQADMRDSDLIPGIYEGGLKVWECTHDLAGAMKKCPKTQFENSTVLDLGCGSGILGILALKMGARSVHFQDYNSDVLTYLTIPSVLLNGEHFEKNCTFWSGDWSNYMKADESEFDIILTSETIYNADNHEKLHSVIELKLKPDGVAYIAGKSYYFGVGGSMKAFQHLIKQKNIFETNTVWTSEEGVKREIIRLTRKINS